MRERGLKYITPPPVCGSALSLPMRERGLKLYSEEGRRHLLYVAPHAGAWIEIVFGGWRVQTWLSLPMRERGLKYGQGNPKKSLYAVAPHAGAWIEITDISSEETLPMRRSPCGSVD